MAFLNVIRSRDRTTRLILAAEKLIFNYNTTNSIRAELCIISVSFVTLNVVFPIDNMSQGNFYEFTRRVPELGLFPGSPFVGLVLIRHLVWKNWLCIFCLYYPQLP